MIKKGSEWFKNLSQLRQRRYKVNCNKVDCGKFKYMMKTECNFHDFISGAFNWNGSIEGHEHWSDIANNEKLNK